MELTPLEEFIPKGRVRNKDAISLREDFIREFLKDRHKWNAAARLGYVGEDNYYFVVAVDNDSYIQNRLREINDRAEEEKKKPQYKFEDELQKLLHISNNPLTANREKITAIKTHAQILIDWDKHQEELRLRAEKAAKGGNDSGVMLVPAEVPLDQWEAWAKWSYSETMKKMEKLMAMEGQA